MKETNTATTILERNDDKQFNYILELIENFIEKRGD